MITLKVTLTKEMESFWGVEDLLEACVDDYEADLKSELIELINEDISAFIENAQWEIDIIGD